MTKGPKEKWYAEGLRFECQRCGDCCRGQPGYVWVMPEEAKEIAEFLSLPREEFAEKYLRKAGSHDSLTELPDGRCAFYGEEGCKIYPVRPMQCRTFPFWRSILVSVEEWWQCQGSCPGAGKGKLYSAEEIEEIARLSEVGVKRPKQFLRA